MLNGSKEHWRVICEKANVEKDPKSGRPSGVGGNETRCFSLKRETSRRAVLLISAGI